MDQSKKSGFVKMGRRHFAKGGKVRKLPRKYFDGGGSINGNQSPDYTLQYLGNNPVASSPSQASFQGSSGVNDSSTNPNTGFLGSIGGGLGLNNQFVAQGANLTPGTNANQLNGAYTGAQGALNQQQGLVNTLNPQASSAVNNQNLLAGELSGMSQGQGPNPAKAELAQATAANNAQTASQIANARGASGNVGLMARQAAQTGAQNQQTQAGQAATLEAQQQIAAQQNLANLSNNQISQTGQATTGLNSAAQNEQSILQNANTSLNNANVGMQSNINNNNAQTSAANQNMAGNVLGGIESAASALLYKGGEVHHKIAEMNAQSMMHLRKNFDEGGETEPNLGTFKASDDSASAPNVASSSSLPADQTDLGKDFGSGSSGGGGGGGGGMSSVAGLAAMMADGGPIQANPLLGQTQMNGPGSWTQAYFNPGSASNGPGEGGSATLPKGATTDLGKSTKDALSKNKKQDDPTMQSSMPSTQGPMMAGGAGDMPDDGTMMAAQGGVMSNHFHDYFSGGGKVPAMVSPGEIYLSPEKVRMVVEEGKDPKDIGEHFKGKAKVKGDSLKNDTIPKTLEEGGVVVDRDHMKTKESRQLFVHKSIAKKKVK